MSVGNVNLFFLYPVEIRTLILENFCANNIVKIDLLRLVSKDFSALHIRLLPTGELIRRMQIQKLSKEYKTRIFSELSRIFCIVKEEEKLATPHSISHLYEIDQTAMLLFLLERDRFDLLILGLYFRLPCDLKIIAEKVRNSECKFQQKQCCLGLLIKLRGKNAIDLKLFEMKNNNNKIRDITVTRIVTCLLFTKDLSISDFIESGLELNTLKNGEDWAEFISLFLNKLLYAKEVLKTHYWSSQVTSEKNWIQCNRPEFSHLFHLQPLTQEEYIKIAVNLFSVINFDKIKSSIKSWTVSPNVSEDGFKSFLKEVISEYNKKNQSVSKFLSFTNIFHENLFSENRGKQAK